MADDVEDRVGELKSSKYALVGHSMGGKPAHQHLFIRDSDWACAALSTRKSSAHQSQAITWHQGNVFSSLAAFGFVSARFLVSDLVS